MPSLHLPRAAAITLILLLAACSDSSKDKTAKPPPPQPPAPAAAYIPDSPQVIAHHNLAVAHMGRFDYDKAHAAFAELVKAHPNWREATIDLAIATLNRQGPDDSKTALALLSTVLEAEPDNLRAHYCRGLLKLHGGEPAEALKHFQTVAAADKSDAFAAYYVAQCRFEAGKFAEALAGFESAIRLDPYQRSAYYGAFQSLQRLARIDDAKKMLAEFEKLKDNPQARLAEFKYSRMGPKGEVVAIANANAKAAAAIEPPKGDVFLDPIALPLVNGGLAWATFGNADRRPSITACDIDGDDKLDLFITAALVVGDQRLNAVLLQRDGEGGKFEAILDHPLAKVTDVNAALWGDYDNDGFTDCYLLRKGGNQLWRQVKKNEWQDVTESTKTAGENLDSVDGAIFDADHDGDLDLFVVNRDGPNELFNNNLDGTFRAIAKERGIAGDGKPSMQVVVADFDGDRDVDIFVIKEKPPHEMWMNDRLWKYTKAAGGEGDDRGFLLDRPTDALVVGDGGADGLLDAAAIDGAWAMRYEFVPSKGFYLTEMETCGNTGSLALADFDGNGTLEFVHPTGPSGAWALSPLHARAFAPVPVTRVTEANRVAAAWITATLDPQRGPAIIGLHSGRPPSIWLPGPGRHPFIALTFTGKEDKGDQLRSNRSGIGVRGAARIGTRFTAFDTFRNSSGPGQSLQPVSIGLAGAKQIDFISLTWPDGVLQTEIALDSAKQHRITETQRQLSSCPVLFAWDGSKYVFLTDCLGVGGIGFNIGNGEYGPPRPWENVMLPAGLLQPREVTTEKGGTEPRYIIKLGEPMEEACYLDAARLIAYDLPPGWKMTLDERFAIADPQPTGRPLFYRRELAPAKATSDRGDDVTSLIAKADLKPAPVGKHDPRFIGRTDEFAITLVFESDIAKWAGDERDHHLILIADGWVEYPYSQTMFAAWQAKADYRAPTLEARGEDGQWHTVLEQFGYPAGMPRQMSLPIPLDKLPRGTKELRIRTNVEVYWDRLALALAEPCPQAIRTQLTLASSHLSESGFAHRTTGPQRQPHYDYQRRSPLWDTRHQSGWYTAFGPCTDLLRDADDATAIIGPGEEIHLEFHATLPTLAPRTTRTFILETHGWCKDMDLYTKDGDTLEPLPKRESTSEAELKQRDELHRQYNTRYRSGR